MEQRQRYLINRSKQLGTFKGPRFDPAGPFRTGTDLLTARRIAMEKLEEAGVLQEFDGAIVAFQSRDVAAPSAFTVGIEPSRLRCMLTPGAALLLSDRVSHHYVQFDTFDADTSPIHVDARNARAVLLDKYFDTSLLRAGRNPFGIAATEKKGSGGEPLLVVPVTGLEKLLVGVTAVISPQQADAVLAIDPRLRSDVRALSALGLSYLAIMNPELHARGLEIVRRAYSVARQTGDRTDDVIAASRLQFGLMLAFLSHAGHRLDKQVAETYLNEAGRLESEYTQPALDAHLSADDLFFAAHKAYRLRGHELAARWLNSALKSTPEHVDSLILRATLTSISGAPGSPERAFADAGKALELTERQVQARYSGPPESALREMYAKGVIAGPFEVIRSRRRTALLVHAEAANTLKRRREQLADGMELIDLLPSEGIGYGVVGDAHYEMGNHAAALRAYEQALRHGVDSDYAAAIRAKLDKSRQATGMEVRNIPGRKQLDVMTQRLTRRDLEGKTSWELDVMRNEVFARHGRIFLRADLQAYFSKQPWYEPKYSADAFPIGLLTAIQQANVALITEYQGAKPLRK